MNRKIKLLSKNNLSPETEKKHKVVKYITWIKLPGIIKCIQETSGSANGLKLSLSLLEKLIFESHSYVVNY